MCESWEPGSKSSEESDEQRKKHFWQSFSTDAGMVMERREEQHENAHLRTNFTCETGRNVTSARKRQFEKQASSTNSIDEGIEKDVIV
jgi:hypothetical protein